MLTALSITGSDGIDCAFSGKTEDAPVIAVTLEPVPSLKDRPGLYRVMLRIGTGQVRANAQPISTTDEVDVMIRAKAGAETFYTIALRQSGAAAMFITNPETGRTFTGRCRNHEPWLANWIGTETAGRTDLAPSGAD